MKMDRNLNSDGLGKYALLNLRKLTESDSPELRAALQLLTNAGAVEWGIVGEQDEFFVMKLKDVNAAAGLAGYANKADETDREWADEVRSMISRAGANSPYCKVPD